jgi:hypothetical protein
MASNSKEIEIDESKLDEFILCARDASIHTGTEFDRILQR